MNRTNPRRLRMERLEDRSTPAAAIAGFNDAIGINSDEAANSPYTLGANITGQGAGEPGWSGTWVQNLGNPGAVVVQSDIVFEGDGALQVLGGTTAAIRDWSNGPTSGRWLVTQYVYVPPGGAVAQYLQDSSIGDTAGSTAAQWRGIEGTAFEVLDAGIWESTGISVSVNTWTRIDIVVDMTARTYDFYVNGQKFEAPDPIGFRGSPVVLNRAHYFITNTPGFYADAFQIQASVAPSVTINQASTQADPATDGPIFFDVVFDEPVTGFAASDVDLSASTTPGSLSASIVESGPMDGTTYTVAVTGMTNDGHVIAKVKAGAALGSGVEVSTASTSTDNSVGFTAPPTVTIEKKTGQADPAVRGPIEFQVLFSESVSGFTAEDVDLSQSSFSSLSAVVTQISPSSYTVAVSGMTGLGTVIAKIPAGVALDSLGAANLASTSSDNTVDYNGIGSLSLNAASFTAIEGTVDLIVKVVRTGGIDNAISFDYSFIGSTAEAADFSVSPAASGSLTWAAGESDDKTFIVSIVDDLLSEGDETVDISLTNVVGAVPEIGAATLTIPKSDPRKVDATTKFQQTFLDSDGDKITIKLTGGQGSIDIYLTDDSSPIERMEFAGTSVLSSTATVAAAKAKKPIVSDGRIAIGAVLGSGLRLLKAPQSDLIGSGIQLDGPLANLMIGDVLNGADITAAGTATLASKLTLGHVGDGSAINLGNAIERLAAESIGDSSITAPRINRLSVDGGFQGNLHISGQGVDHLKGKSSLGSLTVKGEIIGSEIRVVGNIGVISAYGFKNSVIYGGFSGPPDNLFGPIPTTIKNFKTQAKGGFTGTFENSSIYAFGINTANLADVKTDNGLNGPFGIFVENFYRAISFAANGVKTTTRNSAAIPAIDDFAIQVI